MKTLLALLLTAASLHAADIAGKAARSSWADKIGIDTLAVARTTDLERFDFNAAARLSYDLTARLALFAEAEGGEFSGKTLVDSTLAGVKFSFPLKHARPYLIAGAGLRFPSNDELLAGGGGVDVALGKSWRIFAEALAEKTRTANASLRIGAGIGFRF